MLKNRATLLALLGWLIVPCVAAASVSVTDYTGHTVELAHPAKRIVALTPHIVENLFTAGLSGRLVGAVDHSNYPPAAKKIPRVGNYKNPSLEAIVAKRPDLVVAWASGGTRDLVRRLRELGIAVYVDDPTSLSDIARSIRDLGVLGGTDSEADHAAAEFKRRIAALRRRYAHRRPVTLFYEVWPEPLRTLSSAGTVGAVFRLCGGRNIFADASVVAPQVSIESVIARNPQVIVASGVAKADPHWQAFWRRWPAIAAVAHDRFVAVAPDLLNQPTVRIAQGAAELCRAIQQVRNDING